MEDFEAHLAGGMLVDEVRLEAPLRSQDQAAVLAFEVNFRPMSAERLFVGIFDPIVTIRTDVVALHRHSFWLYVAGFPGGSGKTVGKTSGKMCGRICEEAVEMVSARRKRQTRDVGVKQCIDKEGPAPTFDKIPSIR